MGLTLEPRLRAHSQQPLALLKRPLFLALILSISAHLVIWNLLPKPRPALKESAHGTLRMVLAAATAAQSSKSLSPLPNQAADQQEQAAALQPAAPFLAPSLGHQGIFSHHNLQAPTPMTYAATTNLQPLAGHHWESQLHYQYQQRQTAFHQTLALFQSLHEKVGDEYFCQLALNADYSALYAHCQLPQHEQQLKSMLSGAPISWQENDQGLPNHYELGKPF